MHWNGHSWSKAASPGAPDDFLTAVAVRSAADAWAAGSYQGPGGAPVLLLHWNGKSWSRQ